MNSTLSSENKVSANCETEKEGRESKILNYHLRNKVQSHLNNVLGLPSSARCPLELCDQRSESTLSCFSLIMFNCHVLLWWTRQLFGFHNFLNEFSYDRKRKIRTVRKKKRL